MPPVRYQAEFKGYWHISTTLNMPDSSGIYCVYAATRNALGQPQEAQQLLYIGKASQLNDRVSNHEMKEIWAQQAGPHFVYISCAKVDGRSLNRFEAAMINHHQPPCNTQHKNSFGFDSTSINLSGAIALLDASFTVNRH
jgi:excinuclease UvrABC nuclease subunit